MVTKTRKKNYTEEEIQERYDKLQENNKRIENILQEKSIFKELKPTKKSNFIWYATRIGFWVMVLFWGIAIILPEHDGLWINDWIFAISIPFTFVCSIIHLVKYKKKGLAITSLVISSIGLLLLIIGMIIGVAQTLN